MSLTSERIKSARQQKKLTQSGLADLINSSRGSIAKIETDVFTPSFAMLSLIADALDTTVDYLQGKTDNALKTADNASDNGDEKGSIDLKNALDNDIMLAFDGKPISDRYKRIILEILQEDDEQ